MDVVHSKMWRYILTCLLESEANVSLRTEQWVATLWSSSPNPAFLLNELQIQLTVYQEKQSMCRGVDFSFADSTRRQNKVDKTKESLEEAAGVSVMEERFCEYLYSLLRVIDRKRL